MKYDLKKKDDRNAIFNAIIQSEDTKLNSIYRLDFDGDIYEWATNGFYLLAVVVKKSSRKSAGEKPSQSITEWLSLPVDSMIGSADFLTWIKADEYAKCPYCQGWGERPLFETDEWHKDEGKPNYGRIGDAVIDRRLTAEVLAYIEWPPVTLLTLPIVGDMAIRTNEGGYPMVLHGEEWIFIQQPATVPLDGITDQFPIKGGAK